MLFIVRRDIGPGIHSDHHQIIFEPFEQAERARYMRLGRAHGGKLWLESNIDQGSTFYLTLPIRSQVLMQLLEEGHDV